MRRSTRRISATAGHPLIPPATPRRWVDLHLHSTASDGKHPPAMVIEMAHTRGLAAVALTDHDTVAGLAEAASAAVRHGIEFVPGIEMEAEYGRHRLHILGYFFDAAHAGLLAALAKMVAERHHRNERIVERLRSLGLHVSYEEIRGRNPDTPIGRPHIAEELMRQGVVSSFQQAFSRYLGNDAPAYVPRETLSAAQVIEVIRTAGGVASLAHPGRIPVTSSLEMATVLASLRDAGLTGIEVSHPDHNDAQMRLAAELADRFELLPTGGSDFHALGGAVSRGVGFTKRRVPYDWLEALRGASIDRSA